MELEGRLLGDYKILREIGRGGMGVVYLAEQLSLGRRVALKVLPHRSALSSDAMTRFRREAEAASRLDHPNICAVHATGEHEGIPFIAMRFIEGRTLSRRLQDRRLSTAGDEDEESDSSFNLDFSGDGDEGFAGGSAADDTTSSSSGTREDIRRDLEMMEKVARALQAAHDSGVVHRDIKPGNIMITPDDEPVVLDFGLARHLEGTEGPSLTHTGDLMGTPHYMSPEQISGSDKIDARTDVYSLGVTLYELLTLKRPFDAPNREGLYRAILSGDPTPPRQANPLIERDVEIVLECATERDLNRRYQSAGAFADDLEAILNHEEIAARPVGPWLRLRKWARRNPLVAATVMFAFILLLAGYIETSFSRRKIERTLQQRSAALQAKNQALEAEKAAVADKETALEQARAQRKRAEEALIAEQEAQKQASEALVRARALRLAAEVYGRRENEPDLALRLAIEAARERRLPETDQALRHALRGNPAIARFGFIEHRASSLTIGPAPVVGGRRASAPVQRTRLPAVGDIHWDSRRIVTLNPLRDESPLVWDLDDEGLLRVLGGHQEPVRAVCLSPDGRYALTGSDDRSARLFDLETGETVHEFGGVGEERAKYRHEGGVRYVGFSADGSITMTISAGDVIRFWRTDSGKPLALIPDGRYRVVDGPRIGRFHPKAGLFAIIKRDLAEVIALQGPNRGRWLRCQAPQNSRPLWAMEWSPDGRLLATGDRAGRIHLFEVPETKWRGSRTVIARHVRTLDAVHEDYVRTLAFSADGRRLASGGSDRRAAVWDLETGAVLATFEDHRGPVLDVALTADGSRLVTSSSDASAYLYSVGDATRISRLAGHRDWISNVEFVDEDRRIATLAIDGTALVFSSEAASTEMVLAHLDDGVDSLRLSANGKTILATSRQGEVRVLDLEGGRVRARLHEALKDLRAAAFADPEGESILLLETGRRWLRHRTPGRPEGEWEMLQQGGTLRSVAAREAEALLGVAHDKGWLMAIHPNSFPVLVHLGETQDGERKRLELNNLRSRRHVVAVRPGTGEFLVWPRALAPVLVSPDDPDAARELPEIIGWPQSVSFSPDGQRIAFTSQDGEVTLVSLGEAPDVKRVGRWSCPPVWSLEGLGLICGLPEGGIAIIDPVDGQMRTTDLGRQAGPVKRLDLSADGLTLVSHAGPHLWLWDITNAKQLSMIRGATSEITSWVFEPDGQFLIVGYANGAVRRVPLDPLVQARRLSPRPLTSLEMEQFDVGTESERKARRLREMELARTVHIESLQRRLAARGSRENLIRYAERILHRDDPLPELFQEALSCVMTASSLVRKNNTHTLELLSRAHFHNGNPEQAILTARQALTTARPDDPLRARLLRNLVEFEGQSIPAGR